MLLAIIRMLIFQIVILVYNMVVRQTFSPVSQMEVLRLQEVVKCGLSVHGGQ